MRFQLARPSAARSLAVRGASALAVAALLVSCGDAGPASDLTELLPDRPCTQAYWLSELAGPDALDCGVLSPGETSQEFSACVARQVNAWAPFVARIEHDSVDLAGLPEADGLVIASDGIPWRLGSVIRLCDGATCGVWLAAQICPEPYFSPATPGMPGIPGAAGRPDKPAVPGDAVGFGCAGGQGIEYLCPLDGSG